MRYSLKGNVIGPPKKAYNSCADLHELGAQLALTSPNTKETKPAGKGHAYCLSCCAECLQELVQKIKIEFLVVRSSVT